MKTKVLTVLVFLLAYVGAAWADVGRYTQSLDGGGWHLWFDKEAQWRNDRLYLRAYMTAPQVTQLKVGRRVTVLADMGEEGTRRYEGTVAWISDKAEFTPKTIQTRDERANLVYAVKVAVRNDGFIKIGMYGDVLL